MYIDIQIAHNISQILMIHFAHRKKKNKPIPTTSHHFLIFKYNKNNYKLWLIVKKIIKRKGKAIQKNIILMK